MTLQFLLQMIWTSIMILEKKRSLTLELKKRNS